MNHLPFVLREVTELPWTPATTRRVHVKIPIARFGGDDGRMILQDMWVDPFYLVNSRQTGGPTLVGNYQGISAMKMRIGWEGRGYLTEEMVPYGIHLNTGRPLTPTWKFERPYRIDPGEGLKCRIVHRGMQDGSGGYEQTPAIMFHGYRAKDDLPVVLYDAKDTYISAPSDDYGTVVNLTRSTLNCPADSPVYITSVSSYAMDEGPSAYPAPLVAVYSPNGRSWVQSSVDTNNLLLGAAPAAGNLWTTTDWVEGYGWIGPFGGRVGLGEERGWIRDKNESMLIELEMPTNSIDDTQAYDTGGAADGYNMFVAITIRGCLEVPNG